jgi:hypothetical protein
MQRKHCCHECAFVIISYWTKSDIIPKDRVAFLSLLAFLAVGAAGYVRSLCARDAIFVALPMDAAGILFSDNGSVGVGLNVPDGDQGRFFDWIEYVPETPQPSADLSLVPLAERSGWRAKRRSKNDQLGNRPKMQKGGKGEITALSGPFPSSALVR